MLQRPKPRKAIALVLLTIMTVQTFAPATVYALTSGPTAPEYSSFEPVDTTDMVNLQTGDFTYNIPLLEVPGPEGGYPLSLAYHAGIQPDEEASWVGLGWTLNPGAINRAVNGYPDDNNMVEYTSSDFWTGGNTSQFSVGINVGQAGQPSVGFGLAFSNDTYRGFGVGLNMRSASQIGSIGFGGISFGISPYGEAYTGGSFSVFNKDNLGASIGFTTNFSSLSLNGGLNAGGLGISMSSGSENADMDVNGNSFGVSNNKAGKISTQSQDASISIPVFAGVNIGIGYNYTRYWSYESEDVKTNGVLYTGGKDPWTNGLAFDAYRVFENDNTSFVNEPDPAYSQGGSFMDYDQYQVLGQGLAGEMQPQLYQARTAGQKKKDIGNNVLIQYVSGDAGTTNISLQNKPVHFRFKNDFSNKFRQDNDNLNLSSNTLLSFSTSPSFGSDGYNAISNKLAGSRNINYFTNKQIRDESTARNNGFVDASNCLGFERKNQFLYTTEPTYYCSVTPFVGSSQMPGGFYCGYASIPVTSYAIQDQIGGYSITNESGVTYHYGLPVYAYEEVVFSEKIDWSSASGGYGNNRQKKPVAYAYTWLLTSITGPDFVDRDAPGTAGFGKASVGDWGYWVNFNYGKWTDKYNWRNPSEGYHKDLDYNFQNFSMGKKELYYLNSITTRTHTAIFEKSVRKDGAGQANNIFSQWDNTNKRYTSTGQWDFNRPALKLDKIYLINNADASLVNAAAGTMPGYYTYNLPNNVIDNYDINGVRTQLEQKAIRIIDFQSDYSLCKKTPNSNSDGTTGGKLTLKAVNFLGKGGSTKIPPLRFEYEHAPDQVKRGTATGTNKKISSSVPLEVGDVLLTDDANQSFMGVITRVENGGPGITYRLANNTQFNPIISSSLNFKTTKNPPYHKDYHDNWGYYKPDFDATLATINDNQARTPSDASSKNSDVWSLRKIKTSLGSEVIVRYESDAYIRQGFNQNASIISESIIKNDLTKSLTFTVKDDYGVLPSLSSIFQIGGKIDFVLCLLTSWQYGSSYFISGTSSNTGQSQAQFVVSSIDDVNKLITATYTGSDFPFKDSEGIDGSAITPQAANLFYQNNSLKKSGLRVKSITLSGQDVISEINYKYNLPDGSSISSGFVSYEPAIFDPIPTPVKSLSTSIVNDYKKLLYRDDQFLISMSRFLPSPNVMYEYVTVSSSVKQKDEAVGRIGEDKTMYQFEPFNTENLLSYKMLQNQTSGGYDLRNQSFKNSFTRVGNLKRVITYDSHNKKITETVNNYLHDAIADKRGEDFYAQYNSLLQPYSYQGVINQRSSEYKRVRKSSSQSFSNWKVTMSSLEDYPNILIGHTKIDYRTGTRTESKNLAFDFYSGAVTKSVETDANGNRFMTEIVPAYTKYPDMGLKVMDGKAGNKHMLSQEAATYVYKVDASNNKLGLVSAQVQTWSNAATVLQPDNTTITQNDGSNNGVNTTGNVWRKQSSYTWMPEGKTTDGLTAINMFTDYNWGNPSSLGISWKKTGEVTLFDVFSRPLELMDINGNYAASKMGFSNSRLMVSGSPARYAEIAYTGAEDATLGSSVVGGGFTHIAGTPEIVNTYAHTGTQSIAIVGINEQAGYEVAVNKLNTNRDYILSAWGRWANGLLPNNATLYADIDGTAYGTTTVVGQANSWYLFQIKIRGADLIGKTTLKVGVSAYVFREGTPTVYFDDIRFQPLNGVTSSYVYDKFSGELTHVLDNNNLYTRYEYDANGRLIKTYKEAFKTNGEKLISEQEYNYSLAAGKYFSAEINSSIQRNNCPTNTPIGGFVQVYVPYGQFASNISQQDADNQASAHAQSIANSLGSCSSVIYARIELGNFDYVWQYNNTEYYEDCDMYLRFYSDYNCTVPVSLGQTTVFKYGIDYYASYGSTSYSESTVSVPAGNTQYAMGRYIKYQEYWYDDPWYGWTCDYYSYEFQMVNNGSNYIPMATHYF
ncbi:hypothetical protein IQ13_0899 [Lacibacter cauensis]|uniref:DUF5977 domain-containing protein n=1 Tax=Lacibacter cauensis TaxID=510947 RepID=A0A562SXT3_9BACT|nr:DUF5977 domain-containing protein [Lacibacter cauensis]TWI85734.1 hypothetical protein IQ13_0899 [Lacibacter cauensis]